MRDPTGQGANAFHALCPEELGLDLLLFGDVVLIDYSATGAVDGGELYTIKEVGSADTSAFQLVDGNPAKQTLDVVIDGRGYRHDVA